MVFIINTTLFLSPHLDDVVFSCGEQVLKLKNNKDRNSIITTIFTGVPEPKYFSSAAKWFHGKCKLGNNPLEIRKKEDACAMKILGADFIYLDEFECWYRMFENGKHRYSRLTEILTVDMSKDADTIQNLKEKLFDLICKYNVDELYLPLSIGRNIDHMITRKAVEENIYRLSDVRIFYYEDMPYVCNSKDTNWENDLTENLESIIVGFSEEEYKAKIEAVKCYKSQMKVIWGDDETMLNHLEIYTKRYLEFGRSLRFWKS